MRILTTIKIVPRGVYSVYFIDTFEERRDDKKYCNYIWPSGYKL